MILRKSVDSYDNFPRVSTWIRTMFHECDAIREPRFALQTRKHFKYWRHTCAKMNNKRTQERF